MPTGSLRRVEPRAGAPSGIAAVLAVVVVFGLVVGAGWAVAARAQEGDRPLASPARGHAQVVAQGLAALATGDVAWRVTADRTEAGAAGGERLGPGFLVADEGALLVAGDPAGRRALLAPGEAAFVAGDADLERTGVGSDAVGSFAIELVAGDQAGAGVPDSGSEREQRYVSPAFPAPAGERDLDLVRDLLAPGEVTSIAAGEAPTLILATLGAVDVVAGGGEPTTLGAGEAASFAGPLEVTGGDQGRAAFVAAIVGGTPAGEPAGTPVATPRASPVAGAGGGGGAVTAIISACPPGVGAADAGPDRCQRDPDAIELLLTDLDGTNPRLPVVADGSDGVPVWSGLPFGDYALRATTLGDGIDRYFVPGLPGIGGPPEEGYSLAAETGYRIRLSASAPAFRLDVYALAGGGADEAARGTPRASGGTGSIAIRPFFCPGVDLTTFDPAACQPLAVPFEATLAGGEPAAVRGLAEAEATADGRYVWEGLPFGQYRFSEPTLPAGAASYYIPGSAAVGLLPDNSGYGITIDASAPAIVLDLYHLGGTAPAPLPTAAAPLPIPVPTAPALAPTAPALVPTAPAPPPVPAVTVAPPVATAPPPAPSGLDSDADGLTDAAEAEIGTDPFAFDGDGDGVGDGAEVAAGGDPFTPPAPAAPEPPVAPPPPAPDSDGDGLTDETEAGIGTDPFNDDSDGDGWLDSNEINLGTNPLDPASSPQSP